MKIKSMIIVLITIIISLFGCTMGDNSITMLNDHEACEEAIEPINEKEDSSRGDLYQSYLGQLIPTIIKVDDVVTISTGTDSDDPILGYAYRYTWINGSIGSISVDSIKNFRIDIEYPSAIIDSVDVENIKVTFRPDNGSNQGPIIHLPNRIGSGSGMNIFMSSFENLLFYSSSCSKGYIDIEVKVNYRQKYSNWSLFKGTTYTYKAKSVTTATTVRVY